MSSETMSFQWYSKKGLESDVVICSRVRFARNLASFPFSQSCSDDDKRRVQSLIFDAFSKLQDAQKFYLADISSVEEEKLAILQERAFLKRMKSLNSKFSTGLIFKSDEDFSCSVNCCDHLRFSFFDSGLSIRKCFEQCKKIDSELQDNLQFAADYDFGYLTASFTDVGSGMKLSALMHLPFAVRSGKMNNIVQFCKEKKIGIKPAFFMEEKLAGAVPGCFFIIENLQSQSGSEIDQLADFESACRFIAESERKIFADLAENKITLIKNSIIRAYSLSKTSLLVSFREALDMISDFRIGLKIGFLSGITEEKLNKLMYDVQKNYISYMAKVCSFSFEPDIKNDFDLKMDRLRAVILQESLEKLSLGNL